MNLSRLIDWMLFIECVMGLICVIALWAEDKKSGN